MAPARRHQREAEAQGSCSGQRHRVRHLSEERPPAKGDQERSGTARDGIGQGERRTAVGCRQAEDVHCLRDGGESDEQGYANWWRRHDRREEHETAHQPGNRHGGNPIFDVVQQTVPTGMEAGGGQHQQQGGGTHFSLLGTFAPENR